MFYIFLSDSMDLEEEKVIFIKNYNVSYKVVSIIKEG